MTTPTNLAPPRTSFVGRGLDLEALSRAWADGARLVTLVGTAGTGKTRLAVEHALRLARAGWGSGVWFCDLCFARGVEDVCAAVAAALEVPLARAHAVDQLGRAIAARGDVLMLLDNFEQAAAASVATVGAWLDAAPRARFLVTSRERLHVAGEAVRVVEPLGLAAVGETDPARLASADAVRLLRDRTRGPRSGAEVPDEELPALAAIARRLDGIPLALELGAARLGVLGAAQLEAMLARPLDVLSAGARGAPARQATLRGAIAWSWDLLGEHERRALACWSIFRGGFDLDAASALLDAGDGEREVAGGAGLGDRPTRAAGEASVRALDLVQGLHDKSLLRVQDAEGAPGERRVSHYEAVREFAAERLEAAGARALVASAHASWFLALGERLASAVDGPGGPGLRRRLALESENLLAVNEDALDRGDGASSLRALLCLEPLFLTRGPADGYAKLLDGGLAVTDAGAHEALAARALVGRAWALIQLGLIDAATPELERAALLGQGGSRAKAESLLGLCAAVRGDGAEAERRFASARAILDELGEPSPPGVAGVYLRAVGTWRARQGRIEEACRRFEEARGLARASGDRHAEGLASAYLASRLFELGRLAEARALCDAALATVREVGDRRQVANCLGHLAVIEQEQGRFAEAEAHLASALAAVRDLGDRHLEGGMLGRVAALALERGDAESAARSYRAAVELLRDLGDHRFEGLFLVGLAVAEAREQCLEAAREHLAASAPLLDRAGTASDRRAAAVCALELGLARAISAGPGDERDAAIHAARAALDEHRGAAGDAPPPDEVRFALRVVTSTVERMAAGVSSAPPALVVGPEARWFVAPSTGDARVDMQRRGAVRRILLGLARLRRRTPGRAVPTSALVELGWPGERIHPTAAHNRAKVAIATLRRLGLERVLVTRDDGYLLDPEVPLRLED